MPSQRHRQKRSSSSCSSPTTPAEAAGSLGRDAGLGSLRRGDDLVGRGTLLEAEGLGDVAELLVLIGDVLGGLDDVRLVGVLLEAERLRDLAELVGGACGVVDLLEDPVEPVLVGVADDPADARLLLERGEQVVDLGTLVRCDGQAGGRVDLELTLVHCVEDATLLRPELGLGAAGGQGERGARRHGERLESTSGVLDDERVDRPVLGLRGEDRDGVGEVVQETVLLVVADLSALCDQGVDERRAGGSGHVLLLLCGEPLDGLAVVQRKLASFSLYTTAPTSIRHKEESGRYIKKPTEKITIYLLMGC